MKEFIVYTVARIGLFLACWALIAGIYLLVTGGDALPLLWPLLLAAGLSMILSLYLLKGLREAFAQRVGARASRMADKFEEMRAKEDVD